MHQGRAQALRAAAKESAMRVLLWIIAIIFLIGLLVVFGIFDLIF